jgi:hypothetical protein
VPIRTLSILLTVSLLSMVAVSCGSIADPAIDEATPCVTSQLPTAPERPTASARWNVIAQRIAARRATGPLNVTRNLGVISVARYNAVVAAAGADLCSSAWQGAAAIGASAAALQALYPLDTAEVSAAVREDSVAWSAGGSIAANAVVRGLTTGRAMATTVLAYAAADRWSLPFASALRVGPGVWTSAPPPAQPIGARFGEARPWLLTSGSAVRPAAPPAFGSPAYQAALAEVRIAQDVRTPAQLAAAVFWGTTVLQSGGPVGWFAQLGVEYGSAARLDEREMSRMLALVHMAGMDANIACFDAKYHYMYLRPNQDDRSIAPPVPQPNFPAYPSAHSCASAATAGVLANLFPARASDLVAQVTEAGDARLWGGVHFRFDVTAGKEIGDAVAALALRMAPVGWTAIPLD